MLNSEPPDSAPTLHTDSGSISLLGVHLSYFSFFIESCGGRDTLQGLTTQDVCTTFIIPRTSSGQSLCDVLFSSASLLSSANPTTSTISAASASLESPPLYSSCSSSSLSSPLSTAPFSSSSSLSSVSSSAQLSSPSSLPLVAQATWFVSHCWQYTFLDVVDAITTFFHDNRKTSDVIVWFDLFSLDQHHRSVIAAEWLQDIFTTAISAMGNVLMILTPWNNPVTLTRAWCVFELFACMKTGSNFSIALPPNQLTAFGDSIAEDYGVFLETISSLKSENSTATKEADLSAIQSAIRAAVGFNALDRMIISLLSDWMVQTLQAFIRNAAREGSEVEYTRWQMSLGSVYTSLGKHEEVQHILQDCVEKRKHVLGEDHPDTLKSINNLAESYYRLKKYTEAEPLFLNCWERRREVLGLWHSQTLITMGNLAVVLHEGRREHEGAKSIFTTCLEMMRRVLGKDDPHTLRLMGNWGLALERVGLYAEAEAILLECVGRSVRALGQDHPDTTARVCQLAVCYSQQWKHTDADMLLMDAWERVKRVLGQDHSETLKIQQELWKAKAILDRDGAEQILRDLWERQKRILGEDHADTLRLLESLAVHIFQSGKVEEAELFETERWEVRKRGLGEDHPETLTFLLSLARFYGTIRKWDKASILAADCLERMTRVLGEEHRETLHSHEVLAWVKHKCGEWPLAESLYVEVLEKMERALGKNDHTTEVTRRSLLELREDMRGLPRERVLLDEVSGTDEIE
ncbi:Kinesin light chain 3 [Rhizophlyctis rosea]|nr:Kinesin light chain 3 [Rhizophlyctis rosea]